MNSEVDSKTSSEGVRLQKVLAAAGVGSRRRCEQLIAAGRVEVDGRVVSQMGVRVDPSVAVVRVNGVRINIRDDLVYLALNKPRGVLSAMSDSRGRPTVGDLVADVPQRLFHVGRLDSDSEGLLVLTNDGELAHRLMHPSFEVVKTYLATVTPPPGRETARRLRQGVDLEDGRVVVDSPARRPQAHRPPPAGRGRASSPAARPYDDRTSAPRQPAGRQVACTRRCGARVAS